MQTGYENFSLYYDSLTENVNYPQRAVYFDGLLKKHLQSDGRVLLDLACGTGTMSEEMARLGYDVLGVDYSYGMLNQAMQKKMEHGLPIQYICQDMRSLDLYGTVDAAICTLDSLNHLESYSDLQVVFGQVAAVLEPGGVFIFDMNTPYKHENVLGNQTYVYDMPEVFCVWENRFTAEEYRVDILLHFFEEQEDGSYLRFEEEITERTYSPEAIMEAIQQVGLELIGCYRADTEEPLQADSQRMVFVTRKPS